MKIAAVLGIAIGLFHSPLVLSLEGQAAFESGDYVSARAEVTAAINHRRSVALMLLLSQISMAQNQLDEAESLINEVLKVQPHNASAHALNGQLFGLKASRASLFHTGKLAKKSLRAYELALRHDPKLETALLGMLRFRLNTPALYGGSIDKAMNEALKLIEINPIVGKLELADIYAKQNKKGKQIAQLKQLLDSNPEDPRAPLALGMIEQRNRQWEKANNYFAMAARASDIEPKFIHAIQSARYQIGRTNVLSGTTSRPKITAGIDALSAYIKGHQFGDLPKLDWAHYRRGLLFARLKDKKGEAQRDFSLAANTTDRDLQRALKAVK